MLFEKVIYQDDFPINITIASIDEYPLHYHQDIEFIYVLSGEVKLKNGYCFYDLKEGDVFTNAGHEVHYLTSDGKENVCALIQISTKYFSKHFPRLSEACYRTYTYKDNDRRHAHLRELLSRLVSEYCEKRFDYKKRCTDLVSDIISFIDKYFNLFAFEDDVVVNFEGANQISIERISRITTYIYQHYQEKLTLEDLSNFEHLSTFYISHIIKNYTGMNFREFLCFARVEWSEIQLLDTKKKISQIARDVGFSTTAYYEKYFEKWFKNTPAEHRKIFAPRVLSEIRQPKLTYIAASEVAELCAKELSEAIPSKLPMSVTLTADSWGELKKALRELLTGPNSDAVEAAASREGVTIHMRL